MKTPGRIHHRPQMTVEEVEGTVGQNGKAILAELRALERGNPQLIKLRDAPAGLQLCAIAKGEDIQLLQMWGATGGESAHGLETRIQWITGRVYLNNTERMKVANLFQRARFRPISGSFGNFRLELDEGKAKAAFGPTELAKLRDAVLETAKLVRALKN